MQICCPVQLVSRSAPASVDLPQMLQAATLNLGQQPLVQFSVSASGTAVTSARGIIVLEFSKDQCRGGA